MPLDIVFTRQQAMDKQSVQLPVTKLRNSWPRGLVSGYQGRLIGTNRET